MNNKTKKQKKCYKVGAWLCSAALFMSPVVCQAAGLNADPDKDTVYTGAQVTMDISLDESLSDMVQFEYNLYFDDSLYTFDEDASTIGAAGKAADVQISKVKSDENGTYISISMVDSTLNGKEIPAGSLYTLAFTAKSGVTEPESGNYFMQSIGGYQKDGSVNEDIDLDDTSGTITVIPYEKTGKYRISIGSDASKMVGEYVDITLKAEDESRATFSDTDLKVEYDPTKLELVTDSIDGYDITDENGSIRIIKYGDDTKVGEFAALRFKTIATGNTIVSVTGAKMDESSSAVDSDAADADIIVKDAVIDIVGYQVNYPEGFTGDDVIEPGDDYVITALDKNYDYVLKATINGEEAEIKDNGDGTFTVPDVNGSLVIEQIEKTGKKYNVTIDSDSNVSVDAPQNAVYGQDYTFKVTAKDGYDYKVTAAVGDKKYKFDKSESDTYIIPAEYVNGSVVVNVTAQKNASGTDDKKDDSQESKNDSDKSDTSANTSDNSNKQSQTAKNSSSGNSSTNKSSSNGSSVKTASGNMSSASANSTTGSVAKADSESSDKDYDIEITKYLKLAGKEVYLITASAEVESGKTLAYDTDGADGEAEAKPMYILDDSYKKSSAGKNAKAYGYLIIVENKSDIPSKETIKARLSEISADSVSITSDGDINGSKKTDSTDAQIVWDMYNAKYDDFSTYSIEKFLRADADHNSVIDTRDAVLINAKK